MVANFVTYAEKVKTSSGFVYLVNGTNNGRNAWYYIAVDKMKVPLFERLCKNKGFLEIENFGKFLKSGWGEEPPSYIKDKIKNEGAAYDDSEFHTISDHPNMKYYMMGDDENGQLFYAYVIVPGEVAEEYLKVSRGGWCNMSDYGEIVETGWGEPDQETRQKMREQGFKHPEDEEVFA